MHRSWDEASGERYWLRITDRQDLGVDLRAPQAGYNGRDVWSYSLYARASHRCRLAR